MRSLSRSLTVALVGLAACSPPPAELLAVTVAQQTPVYVPQPQNKVDVLFMVDNSTSMLAMQTALQNKVASFLQVFDDLAANGTYADLHIGVVTSDYGAGTSNFSGCDSTTNGGTSGPAVTGRGLLQKLGAAHAADCAVPADGASFIEFSYALAPNNTDNLPPCTPSATDDCTRASHLAHQFTCMASVGTGGCGFEHQLESVYAALQNPANAGFVRDDALLAVVFVTNEDDGSVPGESKIYNTSGDAKIDNTYLQTHYAIGCGAAMAAPGYLTSVSRMPLTGCVPLSSLGPTGAPGQWAVSRYIDFFTRPAGYTGPFAKADPTQVILFGIDAKDDTVAIETVDTTQVDPLTMQDATCGSPDYTLATSITNAATCLLHACQNKADPAFFADPSIRLDAVINAAGTHDSYSICGDDLDSEPDFTMALQTLGKKIQSKLPDGCIAGELPDLANPNCIVQDSTTTNGQTTVTTIDACATSAGKLPCWKVESKMSCDAGKSPQGVGLSVERATTTAPPNTIVQARCATTALAAPDMAQ